MIVILFVSLSVNRLPRTRYRSRPIPPPTLGCDLRQVHGRSGTVAKL